MKVGLFSLMKYYFTCDMSTLTISVCQLAHMKANDDFLLGVQIHACYVLDFLGSTF